MSSDCRQIGTANRTGMHKLLIVNASATVAEGRQESRRLTQPNYKRKRHKVHPISERGKKITLFVARPTKPMEPKTASPRVL